ncbi:MAG: redoxin family protein [Phycisphaerae bacterium]|nr:redoxin family protein [Phycisphaerae bacterium]
MNGRVNRLWAGLLLLVLAVPAWAIKLGDPAPPLKIAQWIKGEPVDLAAGKGKNVYVLEFWATWCQPCRESIPHLTELQKKYKDQGLIVIGITDENNPSAVPAFVAKMGDKMNYTVAYDDNHKTNAAYIQAFGLRGIPHAFVIDREGRIAWSGHPKFGLEQAVEQIITGKYSLAAARTREETLPLLTRYYELASTGGDETELKSLGRQIVDKVSGDAQILAMFSFDILHKPEFKYRDLELALDASKRACELAGERADVVAVYARALWDNGKKAEAVESQRRAVALAQDNPRIRAELEKALAAYEQQLKAQP